MSGPTQAVRCLVSCPECRRQFDAAGFAAGSKFHCACGTVIEVPKFRPHDAAVVRCSSCSAPRSKGTPSCRHCGADYTLHEQDLHTVCSSCMTRVSDRARYCHHCATPIVPQGSAGTPTRKICPACGGRRKLNSRTLGDPPIAILECGRCAGLWLAAEAFRVLTDRARDRTVADPAMEPGGARAAAAARGAFYRPCPDCRGMMNRRNFGKGSGIVIDACKEHGLWFDAQELDAILRWIRDGGEQRVAASQLADTRHRERLSRIRVERPVPGEPAGRPSLFGTESRSEGFGSFLGLLLDL